MTRETREEKAKSRYEALQRRARDEGRPTDELLVLYALECFLARLALSPDRDNFVLKGGMLLAAYEARRPTRDVDMLAERFANDVGSVREFVRRTAEVPQDDGLVFRTDEIKAEEIRDGDEYSGVRVSLDAELHTAILRLKVDVNIGDPISPGAQEIEVDRLIDNEPIRLRGYPLHMVHAEKLVTAVARGVANTRWRDFGDVYTLSRQHDVEGSDLHRALEDVADHRGVEPVELEVVLDGFAEQAQQRWAAWRRTHNYEGTLPAEFSEMLRAVIGFADPALSGKVRESRWDASSRSWVDVDGS